MLDFTAAHLTLPLGSYVRVTNLHNGRSVVVKINDRGPIVPGRIIDLSYNAARALNFDARGLQQVRLDVVRTQQVAMVRTVASLR
jgi:rare lipoprotein A